MNDQFHSIQANKKIYVASDFHLGVPDYDSSLAREKKIVRWLESIEDSCAGLILAGDVFDFWFEYKHVAPKGFTRFLGKLAQMNDKGIPIILFTGNHDLWMRDYLSKEIGAIIYHHPITFNVGKLKILIGHGDGLGPGDHGFKFNKRIFTNRFAQWLFGWLHPTIGIGLANGWSAKSREKSQIKPDPFLGENEYLLVYCREKEKTQPHDYYVFGHRHLSLEMKVSDTAMYINLGDWMSDCCYLAIDEASIVKHQFQ